MAGVPRRDSIPSDVPGLPEATLYSLVGAIAMMTVTQV